jgi:trigger factor
VKTDVETLNPTRVRLTVEVPFEELKPSVDAAYRKVAQQVRIPGFRPGKAPARLIDQRFGRGVVLEEAINDAIPQFYGKAVEQGEVRPLGQPEIEVTHFDDGEHLTFTAEVDVRPKIELPDYDGIEVQVEDADVTDEHVEEQLQGLRDRFAVLTPVERAVELGDFVTIDLEATVDGEALEDATASGMSYEVGKGNLVDGLDEGVTGLSAGESRTFPTTLVGGEHAGKSADVTVTVKAVKSKELPELDDDFAQQASEFDTLDELREDIRERLTRVRRLQQGAEARDKVLETMLATVEVPLPDKTVEDEVAWREQSLQEQLDAYGLSREDFLRSEGKTEEEHATELEADVRRNLKTQFVLDALVAKEEIGVEEADFSSYIMNRAAQSGVSPDVFVQQVMQSQAQVAMMVGEISRGKALASVLERAKVTDASGRAVDLQALAEDGSLVEDGEDLESTTESAAESATESADTSEDA